MKVINFLVFDRHNMAIEELRKHPNAYYRTDIAMLNYKEECPCCKEETVWRQVCFYANKEGKLTGNLSLLTSEQILSATMEAHKLLLKAKIYSEFAVFLH
jgi:hypothetical protein